MNILYIAYSCSPNSGSENSIGWNIPIEMAKRHNVYVLTKQEHREHINDYNVELENNLAYMSLFREIIKRI